MVPFESLGTVSYSHFTATMAVSLAVSTQYTNVTDRHIDRHPARHLTPASASHQVAKTYTKFHCVLLTRSTPSQSEGLNYTD